MDGQSVLVPEYPLLPKQKQFLDNRNQLNYYQGERDGEVEQALGYMDKNYVVVADVRKLKLSHLRPDRPASITIRKMGGGLYEHTHILTGDFSNVPTLVLHYNKEETVATLRAAYQISVLDGSGFKYKLREAMARQNPMLLHSFWQQSIRGCSPCRIATCQPATQG